MTGKLKETDIIRIILDWFSYQKDFLVWRNNNHGVYDVKKHVFRKNPQTPIGVPDIIGIYRPTGQFIGIEVKTKIGVVSDKQKAFLEAINASHGISFVTQSLDDCMFRILRIREAHDKAADAQMGLTARWEATDRTS